MIFSARFIKLYFSLRHKKMAKEKATAVAEKKLEGIMAPLTDYLKYGVSLGTRVIMPDMKPYVYKRRADGIAILDTTKIDKKLKEAVDFLSQFEPEDVIIVCKREAGWKPVEKFSEVTGIKAFTKKYPAGIITNPALPEFIEPELVIVCDPWLDKNAIHDALITKKKIMAFCHTNNYTTHFDMVVPCNNKSSRSLGFVLYLLAREYAKAKNMDVEIKLEDFVS